MMRSFSREKGIFPREFFVFYKYLEFLVLNTLIKEYFFSFIINQEFFSMKIKLLSIILAFCLIFGSISLFAACDGEKSDGGLSIVVTIFPEYDWVKQIIGEDSTAKITVLMDSGVDLHNYQPTAQDMVTISDCDLFIHVGGHSDEWVEGVFAQIGSESIEVINLMTVLGDAVKQEEIIDGMEHVHDENCDHEDEEHHEDAEHHEDEDHAHVLENDEHVWLSLKNARAACEAICDKLCKIDAENAQTYRQNTDAYCEKLSALDAEYRSVISAAEQKTLLFGDRFPFRYLVDDYGIEYFAAFSGCSAESEASFETVAFLAGKIDELGLKSVIKIEGSDGRIAETIINTSNSADAQILTLDSMQTTTSADAKNGTTYLSIMESNLEVLKKALQ